MTSYIDLELVEAILIFAVVIAVFAALLAIAFIVTVAFPKIRQMEDIVGCEGKTIHGFKGMLGEGPVGRMLRAGYLMQFFFWRQFPGYGFRVASQLGNPSAHVPKSLRAWLIWPSIIFWFGAFCLFCVGGPLVYCWEAGA